MGDNASPTSLPNYDSFGVDEDSTNQLSQLDRDAQMAASLAAENSNSNNSNSNHFDQPMLNTGSGGGSSAYQDDDVRAPSEYTTGRLIDDNPFGNGLEDMLRSHPGMMSALGMQGIGGNDNGLLPQANMLGRGDSQFSTAMNPPKVVDLPDSDWMFPCKFRIYINKTISIV